MTASIWVGSSGGVLSEGGVAGHDEEIEKMSYCSTGRGDSGGGDSGGGDSGGGDAAGGAFAFQY